MYIDHVLRTKCKRFKVVDVIFAEFVVLIHGEWFVATAEEDYLLPFIVDMGVGNDEQRRVFLDCFKELFLI